VPVARSLTMGPLRYDVDRAELWQGDQPVRLTTTEVALMRIFAARAGEVVGRDKLVAELGGEAGQASERAVDVQITRLRRKLESDPKQPRYLQTVRGEGYRLAPD
jgi:two-component system phosphate regulon response regulator OmpR